MNILDDVEPTFRASSGREIRSVLELASMIEEDRDFFNYHVNGTKNDFANWIKDVVKDDILAFHLFGTQDYDETLRILEQRIGQASASDEFASMLMALPEKLPERGDLTDSLPESLPQPESLGPESVPLLPEEIPSPELLPASLPEELPAELPESLPVETLEAISAMKDNVLADQIQDMIPGDEIGELTEMPQQFDPRPEDPRLRECLDRVNGAYMQMHSSLEPAEDYKQELEGARTGILSNVTFDLGVSRLMKRVMGLWRK